MIENTADGGADDPRAADGAFARLKRERHAMPDFVRAALDSRGLMTAYRERPGYQQNDYLGWIARARQAETQRKRLSQMLDELERGDVYMNMAWRPARHAPSDRG